MKSPLFLCIFLVALSLCASSPFFAYARSAAPAVSSPSDAQGAPEVVPPRSSSDVVIPGPLRSFLRMAGISQKVSPEEVLPLLARNVFAQGYQGWQGSGGRTEFLILLIRYVQQARELKALAGSEGIIHVSNCEEADSLLRILGYRLRQDCGASGTFLVTANPERAFLTIDSGFPLPELEATLQGGKPFVYPFGASRVAALFTEKDWTSASKQNSKDTITTAPSPTLEGNLDLASATEIAGWAWDSKQSDSIISVDIYDGDAKIATVPADQFREDLLKSRKGNGKHSFSLPTPASLKDGKSHKIRAKVSGTNQELNDSPKVLK